LGNLSRPLLWWTLIIYLSEYIQINRTSKVTSNSKFYVLIL
jgi:hypothetical protein